MQKSQEMKIFRSLYMTTYYFSSTTKLSKETYHPSLGKAVASILIFAIFFTPSNSILSVPLHHNRQQGVKHKELTLAPQHGENRGNNNLLKI